MFCVSTLTALKTFAFRPCPVSVRPPALLLRRSNLCSTSAGDSISDNPRTDEITSSHTPWDRPTKDRSSQKHNKTRFRQHVNPLASQYQQPTALSDEWPTNVFSDLGRALHLDIGCGKGGFLLEVAAARPDKNYLGLEIRPSVVQFAKERIEKHGLTGYLDYVGCNANVDLDRILKRHQVAGGGPLHTVSIQFPDPHFKSAHVKRRVVTPKLVMTLAQYMPDAATVFLQSDVQSLLDDMRGRFREQPQYFEDQVESEEEYMELNIMGIPTEREISVMNRDLPIFRTVFKRTATILS